MEDIKGISKYQFQEQFQEVFYQFQEVIQRRMFFELFKNT